MRDTRRTVRTITFSPVKGPMAPARRKSSTLTDLDRCILGELRADARLSFRMLAKRLGVSTPTVSKRVQRMERAGIIRGYTVVTPELPPPLRETLAPLQCAHCRNPIEGTPRVRTFRDQTHVFCCDVCADAWGERHHKAARSPGASFILVVMLGPALSFGAALFACSAGSCMASLPVHAPTAACVPWTDRNAMASLRVSGAEAPESRPARFRGRAVGRRHRGRPGVFSSRGRRTVSLRP